MLLLAKHFFFVSPRLGVIDHRLFSIFDSGPVTKMIFSFIDTCSHI